MRPERPRRSKRYGEPLSSPPGHGSASVMSNEASSALVEMANPNRYGEVRVRRLRPWLQEILAELAPEHDSVSVLFTSDRRMRELNRTWRGKDRPTDVLSFPGSRTPEGRHLGDVAISLPTARRQARAAGHETERELRILLLHGIVHCLGYDHETDDGEMERLESRLRAAWIPDRRRTS